MTRLRSVPGLTQDDQAEQIDVVRAPTGWPADFVATPQDRLALAGLLSLPFGTPRQLLELAAEVGGAAACLETARRRGPRRGREGARGEGATGAPWADPAALLERAERAGARLVAVGDEEYPEDLLHLPDPPAGFYIQGRPVKQTVPRVAVVGSRRCTALGRSVAHAIGSGLAAVGVSTVSGAARGIDTAGHRGSLAGGGATVAVLGCGIDVVYPSENAGLLRRIIETGSVLSEYGPGLRPDPFRFPARNRIVAALGRAAVVVEGSAGSGSMITVGHALQLGREVFAVPGAITSPLAEVPHQLIRDGARLIRGPDDLLEDLGLTPAGRARGGGPGAILSVAEAAVWDALAHQTPVDAVARAAGMSIADAMGMLVALELRGLVRSSAGRWERRFVQETSP